MRVIFKDSDFKIINKLPFNRGEINWNWISFPGTIFNYCSK